MTRLHGYKALGLGACAGAFLLAGCANAPPIADHYNPPRVGATWSYRVTSSGSYGHEAGATSVMRMAEPVLVDGRKLLKYEVPSGATLQTDQVGTVAVLDRTGRQVMRYDPPLSYEWPLVVGRTWTQDITLTLANGAKMPLKAEWKVEAYETITVPAGTFPTWRVVMTDSTGFRMTTWSMPLTMGVFARRLYERPAGHPQGGAGMQDMLLATVPTVQ